MVDDTDTTSAAIDRIVILGGTGDLTRRSLVPAIGTLLERGLLPRSTAVLAVGRRDWDDDRYRAWLSGGSETGATADWLRYVRADVTRPDDLRKLLTLVGRPLIFYLALPPSLFGPSLQAIATAELPHGSRIVIEKPYGDGVESAQRLNALVHASFPEHAVYRIDHFLHKQTVQNILGIRFANRVLEPLWSRAHISRIDITWDETLALEGRAGYYDHAGALRDMIQNHLLQLLAFVAMEPPESLDETGLRDRKVAVLRDVRELTAEEVPARTTRARYTAGEIDGRSVPNYVDERGVDGNRLTESYAEVELTIDNARWHGVPFRLRTGKALEHDRRVIRIQFRPPTPELFGRGRASANELVLEVDPDRICLRLNINGPGDPFDLETVPVDVELAPHDLPAYARLLLDVVAGDPVLSIRDDEAVEQWRIVEPILAEWAAGHPPLLTYRAGSRGPVGTSSSLPPDSTSSADAVD